MVEKKEECDKIKAMDDMPTRRRRSILFFGGLLVLYVLVAPAAAHAYIDPSLGIFLMQILLAGFFGALFFVRNAAHMVFGRPVAWLRKGRWREVAIALSLANLFFLPKWATYLNPDNYYYLDATVLRVYLFALLLNVLLLAGLFLLGAAFCRRIGRSWIKKGVRWIFLGLCFSICLVVLDTLRVQTGFIARDVPFLDQFLANHYMFLFLAALSAVGAGAWFLSRRLNQAFRFASIIVLVFAPLVLITFGQAAWTIARIDSLFVSEIVEEQARLTEEPPMRVLWLIFDEMDQGVAFDNRPLDLELPEFDRLARESLYATNARSPHHLTLASMPSLLTGEKISEGRSSGVDELEVTLQKTGETAQMSSLSDVFSKVHTQGYRIGVAGQTYHPYCRLFGDSIATCSDMPREDVVQMSFEKVIRTMWRQAMRSSPIMGMNWARRLPGMFTQAKAVFVASIEPSEYQKQIVVFQRTMDNTKALVQERSLDFVFVHFQVPHPPYIYDRSAGDFTFNWRNEGYLDNLALADRAFGELRIAMEEAGAWEQTAVIVSADHGWRNLQDTLHVPFLVKFPGQQEQVTYEREFQTIVTHDLVLALLDGEIFNPEGLMKWLDQNAL